MSKRDNSALIQDMLESAMKIIKYSEGLSFDQLKTAHQETELRAINSLPQK